MCVSSSVHTQKTTLTSSDFKVIASPGVEFLYFSEFRYSILLHVQLLSLIGWNRGGSIQAIFPGSIQAIFPGTAAYKRMAVLANEAEDYTLS